MRRFHTAMMVALALAVAGTGQAAEKTKSATSRSAMGKIASYTPATRTLTLTTGKKDESFVLSDKASIRMGSKTVKADDLKDKAGHTAKVRYSEEKGQHVAQSVMIAREATTQKTAPKTSGAKPPES